MDPIAWNGREIVPLAKATVPLADRGHLLGDGIFETLRGHKGSVFRLDAHLERMRRGLVAIGLDARLADDAAQVIHDLTEAASAEDVYLRVQVSTGPSEEIASDEGARVTGICKRFRPYPMTHYQRGVRTIFSSIRKTTTDPLANVKSLSFLPYVVARRQALGEAAHDALLRNEHGRIAEATTSNVFALQSDALHAPGSAEGALDGVTRQLILELAEDTGLDVVESLDKATLTGAQEVLLSNTIGGVIPVTRIDGKPVGTGKVGEFAKRMGRAVDEAVHA